MFIARLNGRSAHRGFTLVEVSVTIAVLSIMAAMLVAHHADTLRLRRLEAASLSLSADLRLARELSRARNLPIQFEVVPGFGEACYLVHTGRAGDCRCGLSTACAAGVTVLREVREGLWPFNVSASATSMQWSPAHGTVTPTGTIGLSLPDGRGVNHVINLMGRVRTCATGGLVAGYPPC